MRPKHPNLIRQIMAGHPPVQPGLAEARGGTCHEKRFQLGQPILRTFRLPPRMEAKGTLRSADPSGQIADGRPVGFAGSVDNPAVDAGASTLAQSLVKVRHKAGILKVAMGVG
jgi:hypothetical protein